MELFIANLRHRWLEYFLGALVIALTVLALNFQRSVTASSESAVHDLAHRIGKNMLVIPASMELSDFYEKKFQGHGMPDDLLEKIQASPLKSRIGGGTARLTGNFNHNGVDLLVVGEKRSRKGSILGSVSDGQVVLGVEAAKQLKVNVGDKVSLGGGKFRVRKILDPPPEGHGMAAFISLSAAQALLEKPGQVNSMRLGGCWCRTDIPALADDVEKQIPGIRAVTVAGMVKAQTGTISVMKRFSAVFHIICFFVVGGITATIISSQVRRQTREIGLLLAIGASPKSIGTMVVASALIMAVIGAMMGFFAARPAVPFITGKFLGMPLQSSFNDLALTFFLTLVVAGIFSQIPAIRAMRLDPVDCLREK